ncbi:MAG: ATP-binding protein [Mariprofundales bacterium]|nr:ATP-binding protein [Mariprofundales bacterium]
MINEVYIDNFKSLVGFRMKLAKFNCIVGLNGAGKSTILQALDFLTQLADGQIDGWLAERHWDKGDLNSKLSKKNNISFEVITTGEHSGQLKWVGEFNRQKLSCTSESISLDGSALLKVSGGHFTINGDASSPIIFSYQGSILSALKEKELPKALLNFKKELSSMKSMDLLSPHLLRQRARASEMDLGLGGEKLSAFLHELPNEKREKLEQYLQRYYPHFSHYQTRSLKSGWKKLSVNEQFGDQRIETEARHINDGMLRIMAIVAQTLGEHSFLLFDEIEDGINPELIEQLVDQLTDTPQQILVTTHSPMILNYLDDAIACCGVQLIYKNRQGFTRARAFFEIPSMAEKLKVMGPGEVFVDTELSKLVEDLADETVKSAAQ